MFLVALRVSWSCVARQASRLVEVYGVGGGVGEEGEGGEEDGLGKKNAAKTGGRTDGRARDGTG